MRGILSHSLLAAIGLAHTSSSLATYSPISNGPKYSVGIPSGSSISDSTAAPIYFSLTAPSSYRWVGLGIGEQMAGASIFVMYADASGNNVTISARDGGQGHVQPLLDSTLMAGVELLAGSGISNGVMTANVRCTKCTLASSDLKSSPWISAWQTGSGIDSDSTSATIQQHAIDSYRQFSFDLTAATISSDTNPFVAASPAASGTSGGGASSTGSGSSPSSPSSSDDDGSGNSGSSTTGSAPISEETEAAYSKAHGIIMGVTVVLLFPLGAVFMRLVGSPLFHALLQIFALCMLIAGFALGVRLADMTDKLYESPGRTHTIFGTVIFALFFLQPFLGLVHHNFYKKHHARTAVSHTHIWFGRIIMILAVINGGLGLQLAANSKNGEIAYGVVAGVVAVAYAAIVVFKRKGTETKWSGREKVGSRDASS